LFRTITKAASDPAGWNNDLPRLASLLTRSRVNYAVIGGVAQAAWDASRRPTDLDVVLGWGRRNAVRMINAISGLWSPCGRTGALAFCPDDLAAGGELALTTMLGHLDVVGERLAGPVREAVVRRRQWIQFGTYRVAVCSLPDLIAIKEASGSAKCCLDAQRLRSIRGLGEEAL
jgi:hypothetical protein